MWRAKKNNKLKFNQLMSNMRKNMSESPTLLSVFKALFLIFVFDC